MPPEEFKEQVFYAKKSTIFLWAVFVNSSFLLVILSIFSHDQRIWAVTLVGLFISAFGDIYLFLASKKFIKITHEKFIWRSALRQFQEVPGVDIKGLLAESGENDFIFLLKTKSNQTFQLPSLLRSRAKEISNLLNQNFGIESRIILQERLRLIVLLTFLFLAMLALLIVELSNLLRILSVSPQQLP